MPYLEARDLAPQEAAALLPKLGEVHLGVLGEGRRVPRVREDAGVSECGASEDR